MDRRRAPAAVKPDRWDADDGPDELGVFAAERYFYGDDALWCERSSSSLSSSVFRTGTLEHDRSVVPTPTAGTSSSEASWNSRSALLPVPIEPSDEKLRAVAGAATPVAEAEPCSGAESGRAERRRASSSNSNLRRWLLGMAGCACARGDGEESVSADEMEAGNDVLGAGGKKCNTEASEVFPQTEMIPEPVFEEDTAVTVRAGSGRWLLEGDKVLAGRDAFFPVEIAGHSHRRAANSLELPMPVVLHPAATASSGERRRVKSLEKFRPLGDDQGSALGPATQNSAFTIVAGNSPRGAADGGGSPGEDDDAAPRELGCAYPPSEASVVWSVVTADGAASGNFSSAASGYYYHYFNYGEDSTLRHAAAKNDHRRRRSGITTTGSSLLMACLNEKAVDAVGPARSVHRPGGRAGCRGEAGSCRRQPERPWWRVPTRRDAPPGR
ncbi:hypothetical protein GQ55_3G072400 [Panicum hallii var. hallii]|uniref:Uncharacterized protein n=1 Tax=Panicum hallii var. hallii TaxID=1504633 RepID=A0A2T7E6N8_9POAL|nr:hypothetical protein GQ55_3G072400 [Panicum hallii var. hallii]